MIFISICRQQYISVYEKIAAFIERTNEFHNIILFTSAITYRVVLDLLYIFAVSPQYAYAGLTLAPDALKFIFSWIIYILIFLTTPNLENRISSMCLHIQFVITIAPLISYYALNDQSTKYILVVACAVLLQNWILRVNNKKITVGIHISGLRPYVNIFMPIFIFFCTAMVLLWNGFHGLQAFDLKFLYAIRKNATYPPLLPYFLNWITMTILPFFLALSLCKKKYLWSTLFLSTDLILFMVMGNKVIYLSLIVVLGVFIISQLKIPIKLLYIGFALICLVSITLYLLERDVTDRRISVIINAFFGIRFLFIPAQAKFQYFGCFSEYPKVFFADGQIGRFLGLTNPYVASLGQTVFAFHGGPLYGSQSNTGYLGDSYAQFGYLGVLVTAILLALVIKLVDSCVDKRMKSVFMTAFAVNMIILNDGAFLTTLLTGGMFILVLFAMIYSKANSEKLCVDIQRMERLDDY